jgi:hypothetical protein
VQREGLCVFFSKYGKTYDTADGSEQSAYGSPPARPGAQRGGQIGTERWADDGGPSNDLPLTELASRPAWSVLPLRELTELIRRELDPHDPVRLRLGAERTARRQAQGRQRAADEAASADRAADDRYGNAWENSQPAYRTRSGDPR